MASNDGRDEWELIGRSQYDPTDDEKLVTTLVLAIAEAKDADPLDYSRMPPLADYFDPASLGDAFFDTGGRDGSRESSVVTFMYETYRITVANDGWISIYTPTGA
ncbi:HalOD1 output domain-containing protein [Halalkalicoccus ordinarius]|uniref:HalOD1 output domain-containing protein n=1 Tax=Halalkalicoccus ordinarius TaxID=3116651 RepID=UPI00300ECAA1